MVTVQTVTYCPSGPPPFMPDVLPVTQQPQSKQWREHSANPN